MEQQNRTGTENRSPKHVIRLDAYFLDAAGATAPQRADGISILPILTGMATQQKDPIVYAEYSEEGHTPNYTDFEVQRRKRTRGQMQLIRFGKYSGVRYNIKDAQDNFEIYNVVTDPKQKLT